MDDFRKHIETLGISMADSRAAADYAKARTEDELCYAAGEHLALHAVSIATTLRLPKRGSTVLRLMRHVANSSWERWWTTENDAFCLSAVLDLCTVRLVLREENRWPELSPLLDHVFVMAGVYWCRAIQMSPDETERFRDQATTHLIDFQDQDQRTPEQQTDRLLKCNGLCKERIDMPAFVKAAISEQSWIDPWALIRHYDRLAARH